MDLGTVKFGLGIAAVLVVAIGVFFAVYCKIGELSVRKGQNKDAAS